jgi:hypothetical protein
VPIGTALAAFVARNRCERAQVVAYQLPENFTRGRYNDRLAETPPVIRAVQRTAFAATLTAPIPLLYEDFYKKDPLFLLDDLLRKYCACAAALLNALTGTGVPTASGTPTGWFWAPHRHTKDRGPYTKGPRPGKGRLAVREAAPM